MAPNCTLPDEYASPLICCAGGVGTILGADRPFPSHWPAPTTGAIYLLLLLWSFVGVAIVSDCFMAAIETITSQTYTIKQKVGGTTRRFRARVWNSTVANLTLMALGSSAPEILLSVIELLSNNFYSGELGPSTIVGSAAFNLLVIIAVCVYAIPADDSRKISDMRVHSVTATFSILAYLWLVIILMVSSPDLIEVWEAVVTFLGFPFLVLLAYTADRWKDEAWRRKHPFLKRFRVGAASGELPSAFLLDVKNADGSPLHPSELLRMVKQLKAAPFDGMSDAEAARLISSQMIARQPKSRAYYRAGATRLLTGGSKRDLLAPPPPRSPLDKVVGAIKRWSRADGSPAAAAAVELRDEPPMLRRETARPRVSTVGFEHESYAVMEAAGRVTLQVRRTAPLDSPLTVRYATKDGTAVAPGDYIASSGELRLAAGEATSRGGGGAQLHETRHTAVVTIINDDFPGVFHFPNEDIHVTDGAKEAEVQVYRLNGCSGAVSLSFRTADGSAAEGQHYRGVAGTLAWGHAQVAPQSIVVPLLDADEPPPPSGRYFEIEIYGATGGASFDAATDGSTARSLARVTVRPDEAARSVAEQALALVARHQAAVRLGAASYREQFAAALAVGEAEEGEEASVAPLTYAMHYTSLPWKLLFATIPPTAMCNGYLAFFCSLVYIGLLTAVIGDLANLLGCVAGLKSSVVAITLVALGTSLPDTFASKAAALGDTTADAAVGNVTGSNAVNVFLGLGLSWLVGAVRWQGGATAEWLRRYPAVAERYGVRLGDAVGLAVPAGDLGSSVLIFVVCAVTCLAVLQLRRLKLGAELGGRWRAPTALFFVGLWVAYIALSTLKAYSS
ncbi:hypothetical protein AB1Y20_016437 [Prymnesium parvum]|uniref:Calx-beta domain-containing protein n=1 Tax=Prymnesium parvum TaxID=97485 RepID=A0AB34IER6_PRYPA